jgi:hypothetical protein
MSITLTIFFEDRYWVGLFTILDSGTEKYAWVVFEKEPSDVEIYRYVLENFNRLKFSEYYPVEKEQTTVRNPKRRQREIGKEIQDGTRIKKSYEAVKLSIQQSSKKQKQVNNKLKKQTRENYLYDLKQKKRKEKHRGH